MLTKKIYVDEEFKFFILVKMVPVCFRMKNYVDGKNHVDEKYCVDEKDLCRQKFSTITLYMYRIAR